MLDQITASGTGEASNGRVMRVLEIFMRTLATIYCGVVTLVSLIFIALSLYVIIANLMSFARMTYHSGECLVGYALAMILPVLGVHFVGWLIGLSFKFTSAIIYKIYIRLGFVSFLASIIAMSAMVASCMF